MQPKVVKVWNVVDEDEARFIDNNARAEEKINQFMEKEAERLSRISEDASFDDAIYDDQFSEGLDPEQLSQLTDDPDSFNQEGYAGEGFEGGEGMPAPPPPPPPPAPAPAFDEAQIEQMIADAENQANGIITDAQNKAQQVMEEAHNEGYNAGYQEGMQSAGEEIAKRVEEGIRDRREELEQEYQQLVDELEPEMVDTLTKIYQHVLGVELGHQKGIILHLLKTTLSRIDPGDHFMIHVSQDDYDEIEDSKENITNAMTSPNVTFDIVEDPLLKQGECMIETDGGIFDCSLGVEMEELTRKLRLLAYDRRRN